MKRSVLMSPQSLPAGLAILKPGQQWKAVVLVLVVGVTILAGGALVGYASGRNKASPAAASDSQQQQQQLIGVQLPFPDSAAARQLLADPATPGAATTNSLQLHSARPLSRGRKPQTGATQLD